MKTKVLVSGSTGQVGQELQFLAAQLSDLDIDFKDRTSLDLSDKENIKNVLLGSDYNYFINAGAYTAVDKAEDEQEIAEQVNGSALECIAAFAPDNCKVIHISTDYVYNNNPERPLQETDPTYPTSIYAKTKKTGEDFILKRKNAMVIRTSWVYSSYGKNFVKTMLRLGKEKDTLNIVSDQIGTPTYARDLAQVILDVVRFYNQHPDEDCEGIYNYSNAGVTNWADFARKIFKLENLDCKVNNITTEAFNAKAPRPLWSVLSKDKIAETFKLTIPKWEDSLGKCLHEISKAL